MLKCKTYFDGIAYYNKSESVVSKNPIKHEKYKKIKRTSRKVRPFEDWIPFKIDPIFDDISLFDRVQRILEDNKKYASKRRKYDYLLTGKTYCEHGFRRVGDGYSKGQNHYYRSAARIYKFPEKTDCDCRGVNAVILDSLFWKRLEGILTNPDLIKKQAKKWFNQKNEYQKISSSEIDRVNKQISELRAEGIRYAKMRGENTIDISQFEELMMGIKNKKERFLNQVEEIKARSNERPDNKIDINALCEEAISVIKSRESTNQKQIIKDLVDKIIIKKGGDEVETWIHIPINQAHLMGYGTKRRSCGTAKRGEVNAV
jgi:site-specific DNA recombinase